MSKRIFSLILAAVMVFSLLPVFASAEGEDPNAIAEEKTNLSPGEMTTDSMVTNKYLTRNGDAYDLTMSAYATGGTMTQELQSDVPLDIVLVIDQSGSMLATDMASTSGYVSAGNKGWTVSDAMGYYVKDGDDYYQLSADRGYTYTSSVHPYLTDDLLGTSGGEDWHTGWETHYPNYYVMDDSGNLCQLYSRSYGYVGGYDCQFYYYPQGSSSAVMIPFNSANGSTTASYSRNGWTLGTGSMNSNSNRLWTTVYKPSSSQTYNHLYYTKNGQKVYLGSEVNSSNQTAYTGELFYYSSSNQTRLQALKDAAGQFVETVAERSAATGVDHRISVVGFASNIRASTSTNVSNIVVGSNKYSYVNSGLFFNNTFQSFRKLDYTDSSQFKTTSERFTNGVYYCKVNNKFYPLEYAQSTNGGWYWWYLDDSLTWNSYCSSSNASRYTFYEPTFTALTPQQYQSSLVSVYDAGTSNQVNSKINNAIDMLDAYGGTYVSYGIAMANQVFANNSNVITNSDGSTTERKRVVVVFTDGEPGASGYDASVAGEALLDAAALKDTYGASVYTIGLFPGSSSITTQTENFLKQLSSMYFSQSEAVYPEDMDGDKTYYYYDNNEKKTFAVTSDGTVYVWYVSADHGVYKYSLSDYTLYENRGDTQYPQTVYRGRDYWIKTGSGSSSWRQVHYDYVWYDTDGYVVECNRNPSDTSHTQFYQLSDTVAKDAGDYYFPVSDAGGLTAAFKTISESIQTPYTTVSLNAENSVLRDVITSHFSVNTDKTQNPVTFSLEYSAGDPANFTAVTNPNADEQAILNDITYSWVTNADGSKTLDVKGFDYSKWFVAEGHPGYKLIATVHGLTTNELGKLYSNESTSGVYKDDSMVAPLPMPYITKEATETATYVMDFGAKMTIAESGKFQVPVASMKGENGTFFNSDANGASGTISYQLKAGEALSDGANLTMSGADTAIIYGNFYNNSRADGAKTAAESAAWKNVTVVPASSVYFDDSFNDAQNPTTLTVGDGSGYNSGVAAKTTAPDFAATVDFTFTGTGIDVYCTTDKAGQYVRAIVMKDGAIFVNGGERQDVRMKNYSETTRYNVPTVSFRDLPFDTYTLKLIAPASTNYKLDGIRVYNPVADSNYTGTAASEAQATFWNLRDALVNHEGTEAVTFDNDTAVFGVLFLDDASRLDPDNLITSYENNSPKNEIYLDCYHAATNDQAEKPAQSISFTLTKEAADAAKTNQLWIGLSAPDASTAENANTGVVTLKEAVGETPAKTISVTSAVDMYYPITADMIGDGNVVTITNSGTTMISVTNLKVTGVEFPEEVSGQAKVFGAYTMKSLRIAANNGVDPDAVATPEPTPDPTPTPTQQPDFLSLIRQMISDFVSSLFGSIARLFGH